MLAGWLSDDPAALAGKLNSAVERAVPAAGGAALCEPIRPAIGSQGDRGLGRERRGSPVLSWWMMPHGAPAAREEMAGSVSDFVTWRELERISPKADDCESWTTTDGASATNWMGRATDAQIGVAGGRLVGPARWCRRPSGGRRSRRGHASLPCHALNSLPPVAPATDGSGLASVPGIRAGRPISASMRPSREQPAAAPSSETVQLGGADGTKSESQRRVRRAGSAEQGGGAVNESTRPRRIEAAPECGMARVPTGRVAA